MQDLNWGEVPTQRKRKEEKYSFPVVTLAAIEKVGAGRKFSFNKAAQGALGIKGGDKIAFAFTESNIFLRKFESPKALQLTQTCSISDKKTYEFIAKRFDLNIEEENEFTLVEKPEMGAAIFEVVPMGIAFDNAVEFTNTDLGEITEERNLEADLSTIPATPEGGALYDMVDSETEVPDELVAKATMEEETPFMSPETETETEEEDTVETVETVEEDEEEEW